MKIQALWSSVSVVMALSWSGAADAQTATSSTTAASTDQTLNELVVTAERRHTDLQTTAISATVISGSDLANMGGLGH